VGVGQEKRLSEATSSSNAEAVDTAIRECSRSAAPGAASQQRKSVLTAQKERGQVLAVADVWSV